MVFRKMAVAQTPLKQYVRKAWHAGLRMIARTPARTYPFDPNRILLINGAHIGDVVIATSLLPVLRSAFPDAEIGFLTASWSRAVVANHPEVKHTHCVDHWRMNRGSQGFFEKRFHYWKTRRQALREIRDLSYDLAVSMHPWRADFVPLAWQAAIPVRVAFREGLFSPLATVLADYPEHRRFIHQSECQLRLLRELGIEEVHLQRRRSSLAPSSREAVSEVCRLLGSAGLDQTPYCVIHMGAGSSVRELPVKFWREIALRLATNHLVLLTGKGARESSNAADVMAGLPNCFNACDRLSWDGLVAAIRYAQTFYGVDSMAAHVAAAVGTNCVAMYAGMSNLARFRPAGENSIVWSNAVPCSACQRQFGCPKMICLDGFDPDRILPMQKGCAS
jgi:ADP-heptose:LPS heptosyltransferase